MRFFQPTGNHVEFNFIKLTGGSITMFHSPLTFGNQPDIPVFNGGLSGKIIENHEDFPADLAVTKSDVSGWCSTDFIRLHPKEKVGKSTN